MLKLILYSIFLTIGFSAFAGESKDCDKLLNVPERFRSAFADYSDQRYLQPVAKFTVDTRLYGDVQRFDQVELDAVMNPAQYIEETKITAAIENFPQERTININDLVISTEFGEEYGLKVFLAHYLDRYPEIERVEMPIFSFQLPVTYSILRERLARGVSFHQALASTPAVLALKALGFKNFGSATRISDGPGPSDYTPAAFEIWLDMRKNRSTNSR